MAESKDQVANFEKVAKSLGCDDDEEHISFTACWRSPTSLLGSWPIASAKLCALVALPHLAAMVGFVEVDETFIGTEPGKTKKPGVFHKMKVLTLVDRESGQARSPQLPGASTGCRAYFW